MVVFLACAGPLCLLLVVAATKWLFPGIIAIVVASAQMI